MRRVLCHQVFLDRPANGRLQGEKCAVAKLECPCVTISLAVTYRQQAYLESAPEREKNEHATCARLRGDSRWGNGHFSVAERAVTWTVVVTPESATTPHLGTGCGCQSVERRSVFEVEASPSGERPTNDRNGGHCLKLNPVRSAS